MLVQLEDMSCADGTECKVWIGVQEGTTGFGTRGVGRGKEGFGGEG